MLRRLAANPRRLLLAAAVLAALAIVGYFGGRQVWAAYHFRAGRSDLERYHTADARRHFDACLRVRPTDPEALLLAARAARRADDFPEATRLLQEFQRANQGASEESALEYAMLQAQGGVMDHAVEDHLQTLIEKGHAQTPLVLEALARGYAQTYRISQAMSCLFLWLKLVPDDAQALYLRGRVWELAHAYQKAAEDYARVLEIDAGRDDARLRLASVLLEDGKAKDALPHLEELRRRRLDDPEVLVRLGFAWNLLGKTDEALTVLNAVLEKDPEHPRALTGLAQVLMEADRPEEAEGPLRRALARDPNDRAANYAYHQCLLRLGKDKEAAAHDTRRKRIEDLMIRVIEIGKIQMSQDPHNPALHCELGTILMQLGHEDVAVRWLQSALSEDATYRPAHKALADYYERNGNPQAAAQHRRLAGLEGAAPADEARSPK